MKAFLTAVFALVLVSCSTEDGARLKSENDVLKTQLEQVSKERDQLRAQIDRVRAALDEAPATATTPDSSQNSPTPDATTPAPDTSSPNSITPNSSTPDTANPAPSTPPNPSNPTTPDSSSATPPAPGTLGLEPLTEYANNVLSAAQNFKAQTKQDAPTNCANGYVAGEFRVPDTIELRECKISLEPSGEYSIQAKDAAGNSVSLP
jgi:hypothetical protein